MSRCATCGSDHDVRSVSLDMDITPVPLCLMCRVKLLWPRYFRALDGRERS